MRFPVMAKIAGKLKAALLTAAAASLLLHGGDCGAATWQEILQGEFDIVETFDQLRDWSPGGQWYSSAGCPTCPSDTNLPKKLDGTPSIWGLWNSKGLALQYRPLSGSFAVGDVITGAASGTRATVRRVWNLDGAWYLQLTRNNGAKGNSGFAAGESIVSGAKKGSDLRWPLFIGDHGPGYRWRGTGKSLAMNLGDNDNVATADPAMEGLGAQRLGAYFGDGKSGKSGYKKIHVFFMMKLNSGFFNKCLDPGSRCLPGGYDPVAVLKVLSLDSGFTGVSRWGTASEAARVSGPNLRRLNEYGLNFSVFQINGGGLSHPRSIFFTENVNVASASPPGYSYSHLVSGRPVRSGTALDLTRYLESGDWFGVEIGCDIGTLGRKDGGTDFWIYNAKGDEMGHYSVTGENRLMHFDHLYNKLVLGGNRLSRSGKSGGTDGRWWIDDVIIHGSRIGIRYFQLLRGGAQ